MTRFRLMLTLSTAALIASGTTVASEIYEWTDDAGNMHFEDRPAGQAYELRRDVSSARTDNSTVQAQIQARREARAAAEQVAAEAPEEMSKDEVRAEQQKRQQQCQMYRDRLEQFLRSQRLYQEDDSGERQYLSEEQTMAARARVEAQIQEYCGS
jgi:hypothetical protein